MKDYVVINQRLVEVLARQLDLPLDVEQTREGQYGFDAGWLSAGSRRATTRTAMTPDDPRLIPPIVDELRERGLLRGYRPESPRLARESFSPVCVREDHEAKLPWYVTRMICWQRLCCCPSSSPQLPCPCRST